MAALTQDRDTRRRLADQVAHPVAAGAVIHAGALVALDTATGYAIPGATATGLVALGAAEERADNGSGADGALSVTVRRGCFRYANHATDPVERTGIGTTCYIADDQTVAATDGTNTRSPAGQVIDLDEDGVWVLIQ